MTTNEKNSPRKTVALVAHDNRKQDLAEWAGWNYRLLNAHRLVCTGTTGRIIEGTLREKLAKDGRLDWKPDLILLKSGPLGGDQQLGAMIAEGRIDLLVFFWDPLEPHPHDADVKALLRIAVLYNVPTACNRATADFMFSSPLLSQTYIPQEPDFSKHLQRSLPALDEVA